MTAPEHHWLRHSKVDTEVDTRVITADFLTSKKTKGTTNLGGKEVCCDDEFVDFAVDFAVA